MPLEAVKPSQGFILCDLSVAFDTVSIKSKGSCPSSLVLEFTAQHRSGLLLTWRDRHVRWHKLDPHLRLLRTNSSRVSLKGQCSFRFCYPAIPALSHIISAHRLSDHSYADDTHLIAFPHFLLGSQHVCQTSRRWWQWKVNPIKSGLLKILEDASSSRDLVPWSLDISQITPAVTACNHGIVLDSQLFFSPHIANLNPSCRVLPYNIWRIWLFLSILSISTISRTGCRNLLLNAICLLQLIQNVAASLDFNLPTFSSITPLLGFLHWFPLKGVMRQHFSLSSFLHSSLKLVQMRR